METSQNLVSPYILFWAEESLSYFAQCTAITMLHSVQNTWRIGWVKWVLGGKEVLFKMDFGQMFFYWPQNWTIHGLMLPQFWHNGWDVWIRADFRFVRSQWETALLCNVVSHWLGASLESALWIIFYIPWLHTSINTQIFFIKILNPLC